LWPHHVSDTRCSRKENHGLLAPRDRTIANGSGSGEERGRLHGALVASGAGAGDPDCRELAIENAADLERVKKWVVEDLGGGASTLPQAEPLRELGDYLWHAAQRIREIRAS
jgi:hypothetical protein